MLHVENKDMHYEEHAVPQISEHDRNLVSDLVRELRDRDNRAYVKLLVDRMDGYMELTHYTFDVKASHDRMIKTMNEICEDLKPRIRQLRILSRHPNWSLVAPDCRSSVIDKKTLLDSVWREFDGMPSAITKYHQLKAKKSFVRDRQFLLVAYTEVLALARLYFVLDFHDRPLDDTCMEQFAYLRGRENFLSRESRHNQALASCYAEIQTVFNEPEFQEDLRRDEDEYRKKHESPSNPFFI